MNVHGCGPICSCFKHLDKHFCFFIEDWEKAFENARTECRVDKLALMPPPIAVDHENSCGSSVIIN